MQNQDTPKGPAAQLKLIKSPTAPYPEEALKKNIEGKVTLSIVVDAKGNVSHAKALSGPPELLQTALDSVKQWQFEPPAHAPVVTTAEVAYGHPKGCPGPVSDSGLVTYSGRLKSERGTIVDIDYDFDAPSLPYTTEDRESGVAGEMGLSITVNAAGRVTNVRVIKSLSPQIDNAAIKAVRTWRLKLKDGSPSRLPDDFSLHAGRVPRLYRRQDSTAVCRL